MAARVGGGGRLAQLSLARRGLLVPVPHSAVSKKKPPPLGPPILLHKNKGLCPSLGAVGRQKTGGRRNQRDSEVDDPVFFCVIILQCQWQQAVDPPSPSWMIASLES